MRSSLTEELRALGTSLGNEAAAELEAYAARQQAGDALNAMLMDRDTPLGKNALANALSCTFVTMGYSTNDLGPEGRVMLNSIQICLNQALQALAMNLKNGTP